MICHVNDEDALEALPPDLLKTLQDRAFHRHIPYHSFSGKITSHGAFPTKRHKRKPSLIKLDKLNLYKITKKRSLKDKKFLNHFVLTYCKVRVNGEFSRVVDKRYSWCLFDALLTNSLIFFIFTGLFNTSLFFSSSFFLKGRNFKNHDYFFWKRD